MKSFSLKEKNDFQEWVYDEINHYPSVQNYLRGNSPDEEGCVVLIKEVVAGAPIADIKELLYFCDLAYRRIEANETWEYGFDYSPEISPFPLNTAPHFQHLMTGHIGAVWIYHFASVTFPTFYPKTPIGKRFLERFENGLPTVMEGIEWMNSNDMPTPADSRIKSQVFGTKSRKVKSKVSSKGFGN